MQDVRQELYQGVNGVVRVAGIGANDRILGIEIERFADVFDSVLRCTIELVEPDKERDCLLYTSPSPRDRG